MVKFLAKQNLAFRGHREQISSYRCNADAPETYRGNFIELTYFLAEYDSVMNDHLQKVSQSKEVTVSYLSEDIQNELVDILGNSVRQKILEQVKESKYYAIR